jgi:ribulose-5-phosphate 4-epimerase/fuculose-1-phosphate aldolase
MNSTDEIAELRELSARVGRDPLQVQASSGNTSIKIAGTLWIKESGKWLADAQDEDILVPLDLADVLRGEEIARGSVETAMHAVLPHRVVVHTHSVNAIAWAVRKDGAERLAGRLAGFRWRWIPYVASGRPLARAIEDALDVSPGTNVLVLANHGLVVCGDDCAGVERLLFEVEKCLAIEPRAEPDEIGMRIIDGGVLYPCQAIFLGPGARLEDSFTRTQRDMLSGLLQVARRIPEDAAVRYLSEAELAELPLATYQGDIRARCVPAVGSDRNILLASRRSRSAAPGR